MMELNDAKHRALLEIWQQRVYERRNSGIPAKQWCREHEISISSYYRWQRAVWKSEKVQAAFQEVSDQPRNELQIAEITLSPATEQSKLEMVQPVKQEINSRPRGQQSREQSVAVIRKGSLSCEIKNGHIAIDNGSCERAIKPLALLRRNCLFSTSVDGAESTAIAMSLVETAKACGANNTFYRVLTIYCNLFC